MTDSINRHSVPVYSHYCPEEPAAKDKPVASDADRPGGDLPVNSSPPFTGTGRGGKYAGELKGISPNTNEAKMSKTKGLSQLKDGVVQVVLDSGLKVTVGPKGANFEQLNTGTSDGSKSIAAWYSAPIGDIDFSQLEPGSVGPGLGGYAERIGNPESHVDLKTQNSMIALYDALKGADTSSLSGAQKANIDKVLKQITPFLSLPARGTTPPTDFQVNNIVAGDREISVNFRGANETKDAVLKNGVVTVEYFKQPSNEGLTGFLSPVESAKVELDLSDIDSWTPAQKREAGDLKTALQNVDTEVLTPVEFQAHKHILSRLDGVAATPQMVTSDDGTKSVGGNAFKDYIGRVFPPKMGTTDGSIPGAYYDQTLTDNPETDAFILENSYKERMP